MSNFKDRLYGSILLTFTFAAALYTALTPYYSFIFTSLFTLAVTIACWELESICHTIAGQSMRPFSTIANASFLLIHSCQLQQLMPPYSTKLILWLYLLFVFLYHFISMRRPVVSVAIAFLPLIYLTLPLSTAFDILYYYPASSACDGRFWLCYLFLVVKSNDVGAYIFGKLCGKTPLARYISPKKTWEGSVAGIIVAMVIGWAVFALFNIALPGSTAPMTPFYAIMLAFPLAIFAQLGDLAESLFKRDAGIKDSNSVLPGLGGMLDLLDALVFSTPLLYISLLALNYSCH